MTGSSVPHPNEARLQSGRAGEGGEIVRSRRVTSGQANPLVLGSSPGGPTKHQTSRHGCRRRGRRRLLRSFRSRSTWHSSRCRQTVRAYSYDNPRSRRKRGQRGAGRNRTGAEENGSTEHEDPDPTNRGRPYRDQRPALIFRRGRGGDAGPAGGCRRRRRGPRRRPAGDGDRRGGGSVLLPNSDDAAHQHAVGDVVAALDQPQVEAGAAETAVRGGGGDDEADADHKAEQRTGQQPGQPQ